MDLILAAAESNIAEVSVGRPFFILGVSIAFIIFAITYLRLHAFIALILAAMIAGWMIPPAEGQGLFQHFVKTVDLVGTNFGGTAGKVGLVIALASIVGMALLKSGAADMIVSRFMKIFGEKNAGFAMLVSGFFLSIPVFFDTVFFLLVPLARALSLRTGKNFMLYVLAIGGGGAITHSIVPPTPGPLLVGELLSIDLGSVIIAGLIAGILPAIGALYLGKWIDGKMPVPVRETPGSSLAELNDIVSMKDEDLPPFWLSVLPVILPAILIATASFFSMVVDKNLTGIMTLFGGESSFNALNQFIAFLGNKVIALMIGAFIAVFIYIKQAKLSLNSIRDECGPALETAGLIILITSAGGSFGAMIRESGVGPAIEQLGSQFGINYIFLAWAVTAIIRIAQGSATVAMITGAGLMAAVIGDGSGLEYHKLYIFLAVGFGSITLSWMNDSGFWIVCKLSGFTEKETLKSWTVLLTFIAVVGLIETYIISKILPLV